MLKIENLCLDIGEFRLQNINLTLSKKEYFVILGKIGSGKTLFLEIIAGRYGNMKGTIIFNSQNLNDTPPETRGIGFVYQNFELFEHMNVYQNIAFPLKIKKTNKNKTNLMVNDIAEKMNIEHLLERKTVNLSGGEKQRVALARALILKPGILLLDEPMSALGHITKIKTRKLLKNICLDYRPIVIHVTHNIPETLFFSDKVGIMKDGKMENIITINEQIGLMPISWTHFSCLL